MQELINRVLVWAHNKGILEHGTVAAQAEKTCEEADELLQAVELEDKEEVVDGIGDTLVTLIIQAQMQGLSVQECLETVLMEIEGREGSMINGTFVKREV